MKRDEYDESQVYGSLPEASQSGASMRLPLLAVRLERYFLFWLNVPSTLSMEDVLERLRNLRSSARLVVNHPCLKAAGPA